MSLVIFDSKMNGPDLRDVETAPEPVAVQIPVSDGPISDIAVSPDGSRLLVTNHGGDSVSVIDTAAYRVVQTIAGLEEPFVIATDATDRAYLSTVSNAYDAIQVLDTTTGAVIETHPVALSVSDLAVSADGKHVYIGRNGVRNADIAVLDTATGGIQVVDIATDPGTTTDCVRLSPDGTRLYVGVNGPAGGQLVVVDTGVPEETGRRSRWRRRNAHPHAPAVIATIGTGLPVRDVAISPNGSLAYVASTGPDFAVIDVVDTRTTKITGTRKITEVTGILTRLTLSGDGDRAYLVSDDSVTILCTLTQDVIDSVNVAAEPSCVAESRDGRYLYIADYSGVVLVTPLAASLHSDVEPAALESKRSVDLFVPDVLQYDPALV